MIALLVTLEKAVRSGRAAGMLRSVVQAGWATLFAQTWVTGLLDEAAAVFGDSVRVTALQATMATIAVLWAVGDKLQTVPAVQGNRAARLVVAVLMGGTVRPDYTAVQKAAV